MQKFKHTLNENRVANDKNFAEISERISSTEDSIQSFKEEMIQQSKPKFNSGGGFGMM